MTENFFESAREVFSRDPKPESALCSFWYTPPALEEDYPAELRVELERARPLSQYDLLDLTLIALRVKKNGTSEIWYDYEPEWIQAVTPRLETCGPYQLGTVMARIRDLRNYKARHAKIPCAGIEDRDIPPCFWEGVWRAVQRNAPLFESEDVSKILSGIAHEGVNPPWEIWHILNSSCVEVLQNPPQKVSRIDLMNVYSSYSGLLQQMRPELKKPYFRQALSCKDFRPHDYVRLGVWASRLAETLPDTFENLYYDTVADNWKYYFPSTKARALWSTAIFSVLKPLPDSAHKFLAAVTPADIQSLLTSEMGSPLPVAMYRLFSSPNDAAFQNRSRLFKPLDPLFIQRANALGLPVTMRDDIPCAVETSGGAVLVQVHPDRRYVRDENGGRRRLKGSTLLKTAASSMKFSEPILHLSEWAAQQMTDSNLASLVDQAVEMPRGVYRAVRFPTDDCFALKPIKIEPAPSIPTRSSAMERQQPWPQTAPC